METLGKLFNILAKMSQLIQDVHWNYLGWGQPGIVFATELGKVTLKQSFENHGIVFRTYRIPFKMPKVWKNSGKVTEEIDAFADNSPIHPFS